MSDNLDMPVLPELKTFHTASASQVKTWRDCRRKWWYEKILGLPTPTSAAMAFGTKVHAQLEDYVEGKIKLQQMMPEAVELLKYIPDPKEHKLITEAHLTIPAGSGWAVNVTGKIDLMAQPSASPQLIKVIDYKTTKNFAYVPTAEKLRTDPQRLIYTAMVFHFEPAAEIVDFALAYTLKNFNREPESRLVTAFASRGGEGFETELRKLRADLYYMKSDSLLTEPEEVEPNYESCGNYGGCPFRSRCPGCPASNSKGTDIMSLFNSTPAVPQQQPAPVQAAPQPQAQPEAAGINPPVMNAPAAQSPLLGMNPQAGTPAPQAAPAPAPQAALAEEAKEEAKEEAPKKRKRRTQLELKRDRMMDECNGDITKLTTEQLAELIECLNKHPLDGVTVEAVAAVMAQGQPAASPTAAAPTAAAPTPAQVAPEQHAPLPVAQAAPAPAPVAQTQTQPQAQGSIQLFINCRPVGQDSRDLSTLLTPIFNKIEKDNSVAYWTQVEFGKGVDQAAGLLNMMFDPANAGDRNMLGLFGNITVDGRDPSLAKLINVLKRHASLVVEA